MKFYRLMMLKIDSSSFLSLVDDSSRVLITTHQDPDGDAIGSSLAMYQMLDALGKDVTLYVADNVEKKFPFLPWIDAVRHSVKGQKFDTVIVLDCSNFNRIKQGNEIDLTDDTVIINMDHHMDNDAFGTFNMVVNTSSVGELLYLLFSSLNWILTVDVAICLYVAIVTDTGRFLYGNTTSRVMRIMADLMDVGVDSLKLNQALFESKTVNTFKAYELAMRHLVVVQEKGYAYTCMPRNTPPSNERMIDFIRQLKGIDVFLVFQEFKEHVKINLRSKNVFDVSAFSQLFGGGGHARASGIRLAGGLPDIRKKILFALDDALSL